jgi:hypothetical protein
VLPCERVLGHRAWRRPEQLSRAGCSISRPSAPARDRWGAGRYSPAFSRYQRGLSARRSRRATPSQDASPKMSEARRRIGASCSSSGARSSSSAPIARRTTKWSSAMSTRVGAAIITRAWRLAGARASSRHAEMPGRIPARSGITSQAARSGGVLVVAHYQEIFRKGAPVTAIGAGHASGGRFRAREGGLALTAGRPPCP